MEPDYDIMYRMDLGTLDVSTAYFSHEQHTAELDLPRDQWTHMGRPGTIDVMVKVNR